MDEALGGQGGGSRPNLSRRIGVSMVVVGAVAAIVGVVLLRLPGGQASFGWFAYAPLSDAEFFPLDLLLSPQTQAGIGLVIAGVALLAFGAGWLFGQRQAARQRRAPDGGTRDPSSP